MIKAIIIDDEQAARDALAQLIAVNCPQLEITASATSVQEAIQLIDEHQPDVLFLDIEMPEQNGFNLLEAYDEYPFSVIFTTAYHEYAIQAIRFSALDYLLKPIQKGELLASVERVLKTKNSNERLQNLKDHDNTSESNSIMLNNQDGFEKVKLNSIVRFEAYRSYTFVCFANGKKSLISKPLRHFEEMLEEQKFIRCHRSHFINQAFVVKVVKKAQWSILLTNNESIPISHRRRSSIIKQIEG